MSVCIGWEADPLCPVYGAMHGCELPDGHPEVGGHVCACGTDNLGQPVSEYRRSRLRVAARRALREQAS